MNQNKNAGLDNLPVKFLKESATVLGNHISQISNLLKYSMFPSDCKISKLKPL